MSMIYLDRVTYYCHVTYGGEQIRFNMSLYREGRSTEQLSGNRDPFEVIDTFIDTLSEKEKKYLFDFYFKARVAIDDQLDSNVLLKTLQELIAELSQVLTLDRFRNWYLYKSGIAVPAALKDSVADLDDPTLATEAQTYTRNDYIGLCALSMAMTVLSPIFSEYVTRTAGIHGTVWKNYAGYRVLMRSDYHLTKSSEMARLYEYIAATLASLKNVKTDTVVISGISTDELPAWMLGVIVLKKIATGDVVGDGQMAVLIAHTYKYIDQKTRQFDKDFSGTINHRKPSGPKASGSEDGTVSLIELLNPRQDIADNLPIYCDVYLSDIQRIAKHLDPTIPQELIDESRAYMSQFESGDIEDGPLTITQWVMSRIIPARMMLLVNYTSVINSIIAARTWLWHHGHYELAALCSALPISNDNTHMVTGTDRRNRMVFSIAERVEQQFPYYRDNTGSKKVKPVRGIEISANAIAMLFDRNDWHLTIPERWMKDENLNLTSRHYSVPSTIRLCILELGLELAELPRHQSPV